MFCSLVYLLFFLGQSHTDDCSISSCNPRLGEKYRRKEGGEGTSGHVSPALPKATPSAMAVVAAVVAAKMALLFQSQN